MQTAPHCQWCSCISFCLPIALPSLIHFLTEKKLLPVLCLPLQLLQLQKLTEKSNNEHFHTNQILAEFWCHRKQHLNAQLCFSIVFICCSMRCFHLTEQTFCLPQLFPKAKEYIHRDYWKHQHSDWKWKRDPSGWFKRRCWDRWNSKQGWAAPLNPHHFVGNETLDKLQPSLTHSSSVSHRCLGFVETWKCWVMTGAVQGKTFGRRLHGNQFIWTPRVSWSHCVIPRVPPVLPHCSKVDRTQRDY